jgi:4-amino-4-deoxy-L-arabinose transferase-like glycosyltransferase
LGPTPVPRLQASLARKATFWACLLALGASGAGLLLFSTPLGVGLSWDSFTYISSAHGLLDGLGFARLTGCGELKPMTGYPPLYPLVLAGFEWAGLSAVRAARVISALSLAATVLMTGILAHKMTSSTRAALLSGLLALSSSTLLAVFSWAWTEPPFVVLCLGCLLLLSHYLKTQRAWALLAASACLCLAMLLRYAGMALLATVVVVLVIDLRARGGQAFQPRWKSTAASLALGTIPLAVWMVRNFSLRGNIVNRHLEWHPLGTEHVSQFSQTLAAWLLPASINPLGQPMTRQALDGSMAAWVAVLAMAALVLAAFRTARAWRGSRRMDLESLLLTWILVYLAFIAVSLALVDPRIPLDDRILSPVFVPAVLLVAAGTAGLWRMKRVPVRVLVIAGAIGLVGLQATQLDSTVRALRSDGQGYAATQWRSSRVLESLREQKPEPVYTNEVPALYFSARLSACSIPVKGASLALEEMRRALRVPGAALVLFGRVSPEFVPEDELTKGLLELPSVPWDGRVFVHGGAP